MRQQQNQGPRHVRAFFTTSSRHSEDAGGHDNDPVGAREIYDELKQSAQTRPSDAAWFGSLPDIMKSRLDKRREKALKGSAAKEDAQSSSPTSWTKAGPRLWVTGGSRNPANPLDVPLSEVMESLGLNLSNERASELEKIIAKANEKVESAAAERDNKDKQKEPERKVKIITDKAGRHYATGRRKTATARVWIAEGSGKVEVNGMAYEDYFSRQIWLDDVTAPLRAVNLTGKMDVWCSVKGGGKTGQAQAIQHGVARALRNFNDDFAPMLKAEKLLTRDSRMVERKKPGQPKARKKYQWVKR